MMKKGIHDELKRFRLMIEGALVNPKIMQALAKVGYDRKEILRGKGLLTNMENQQQERENEANTQKEMTQRLHAANAEAYTLYANHLKFARLVVPPGSKAWNDMKLSGARKRNGYGWIVQAKAFYLHAGAVGELLAQRGISAEELTQAQAMIQAVEDAQVQQNLSRSNFQMARVRRDQERKALQVWMRKFIRIARFAFEEDKQQLEALGIVVPAER